ncbi:winged helix-turn-helix domain-containing protein [Niameybacter sp.]|uniref:winged helix-turn-helix domain-containing protein n=1 Tax=Niameybacter sp. TaxID=2033640 RepID=UPI002FC8FF52
MISAKMGVETKLEVLKLGADDFISKPFDTRKVVAREYAILELLMSYPKKVFTKVNLFEVVWKEHFMGDDNTVNGLDPAGIMEFRAILQKLNQERKVTILISSHILSELEQLATIYGFIHEGKLIEQVSAKTLEERCQQHLIVKVDNPKKASIVLEEELHCTAYEMQAEGTIKIYSYLDQLDQVVTQFAKAGIKVFSLAEVGINLEDYFMQLVGGMTHA